MKVLLMKGLVLDINTGMFQRNDILIEGSEIQQVGKMNIDSSIEKKIDLEGKMVIPGLINAHMHSYAALSKGTIDNLPLDLYMLHAIRSTHKRNHRAVYVAAAIDAMQMLKTGTTAMMDHFAHRPNHSEDAIHSAAQAYVDCGIRARIAPMFSDMEYCDTIPLNDEERMAYKEFEKPVIRQSKEAYADICKNGIREWNHHGSKVKIMIGTDSPNRCSRELLELTGDLMSQFDVGWHTHLLESKTQQVIYQSIHKKSPVQHLEELGLLNSRVSLVHYVWGNEEDHKIIARNGVNIVHCPSSNLHLGSGISPVNMLREYNIPVSIGSDGGNCGNLNMWEKNRMAALLHRIETSEYTQWITAIDVLRMNVLNGARAMLEGKHIGKIEKGYKADLVILNTNNGIWQPSHNLLNHLVFSENGTSVEKVMVDGEMVMDQGVILKINENDIIEEAKEIVAQFEHENPESVMLLNAREKIVSKMYRRVMNKTNSGMHSI